MTTPLHRIAFIAAIALSGCGPYIVQRGNGNISSDGSGCVVVDGVKYGSCARTK